MKKIVTASSNPRVIDTIKKACSKSGSFFTESVFNETEAIISFIQYELPEIKVIDFTSPDIDAPRILSAVREDSWLHFGGIIAVCKDRDQVKELEDLKDGNILVALKIEDFELHFERLLRILRKNQQFLYTRGMQDMIGGEEQGSFECGNDPMDLRFYTNFLVSYLYNTNRISDDDRVSLQMILMELLANAVEHGNLNITYEEKSEWLKQGGDILSLIQKRSEMEEYKNRHVHISYLIKSNASAFRIRDDGDGFDWKSAMEKKSETGNNGRGIMLTRQCVKKLEYNEKGNQVTFSIANRTNSVNMVPRIMEGFDILEYHDKDVVFRQDELSNDLFFVVSGKFAVYTNNEFTTMLSTNDIFIGDMAFLLNDRRTSTVVAIGDCKLIKVPKKAFLSLIRTNPHYGIFLSRLLAQRLVLQTQTSYVIQQKLNEVQSVIKTASSI